MLILLVGFVAVAAACGVLGRRLGRRIFLVAAVAPAAMVGWALSIAPGVIDGEPHRESLQWVPSLNVDLTFQIDGFALLMTLVVAVIGVLVCVYSAWYFGTRDDLGRLAGLLVLFAGGMHGLVTTDNLFALFVFWEITSVTSYLLIGFQDRTASARAAALRALLTTTAAGLAMFAGFVLLAQLTGTSSITSILASPPSGAIADVAVVLVLLGAFAKSAQVPFHYWLPGAMAAPTPVSTFLHSATMVKAGVFVIARFAPAFADAGIWRPLVVTVGLTTMFVGGWQAIRQTDLKLLLAHSTVSQLGLMVVLFGVGIPEATTAAVIVLVAHAAFKASLFMVVGIIDHQAGTREVDRLTGLARPLILTFAIALAAAASMAGLPPLFGFIGKESSYEAFLGSDEWWLRVVVLAALVIGSMFTVAYSIRLVWGAFASKGDADRAVGTIDDETGDTVGGPIDPSTVKPPYPGLWVPAALLAVIGILIGLAPALVNDLLGAAAGSLFEGAGDSTLALWHGFNTALALSVLAVVGGATIWLARRPIAAVQAAVALRRSAAELFDRGLARTLRFATFVTGRSQPGSLPIYLMVILTTLLVLPGGLLLIGFEAPPSTVWFDRWVQVPVAVIMVVATVGAVMTRHRLAAVICVGAVGYGIAVLFVAQGAPDLALTQLLVETLVVVIFVLVLRHLPKQFSSTTTALHAVPRVVVSIAVGVLAAVFIMVSYGARPPVPPVSDEYVARALPEAEGRNIVNVILVDFRAFDTLGEIVVLTVCGLGVIGLVRSARRDRQRSRAGAAATPFTPSPILTLATKALFRPVILMSVVLLVVGHDRPGGGFIGGLVAGAALTLVFLTGGGAELRRTEPLSPEALLGAGVALAAGTGVIGWLVGGDFLAAEAISTSIPLIGTVKITTALSFDIGVYLVVVGLVMALLRSLGREEVYD